MRILITRPEPDASELAATLASRGHDTLVDPMLDVRSEPEPDLDLDGVTGLIVTSRNAVRAIKDWRRLAELKTHDVFAVGERTKSELEAMGFSRVRIAAPTAEQLGRTMAANLGGRATDRAGGAEGRSRGIRFLHLSGDAVAGDIVGQLGSLPGVAAERVIVYRARPAERLDTTAQAALADGQVDCAMFYSPRTAATFARLVGAAQLSASLQTVTAACLSAQVADGLGEVRASFRDVRIPRNPKGQEMLALIDLIAAELHQ